MPTHLIGAHMPTGKGYASAVRAGKEAGCTAVQIFTSSPQRWSGKDITDEEAEQFAGAMNDTGMGAVVSHDSYLINLCAVDPEIVSKSLAGMKREIERCAKLGVPQVVSHMGAHMGRGIDEGLRMVAENALQVLAETPDTVRLLMETTAGQGTVLNSAFEELAQILELVGGHPRLGVCLDTCHVFAAGYDISTDEGFAETFDRFGELIGFDRLGAIHANDSKNPLGSRKDRHEHIGLGEIGPRAFELLVNDPRMIGIPILVETPEAETHHAENVARLWGFTTK